MTDTPESATPTGTEATKAPAAIRVLTQYIKDLSFENPGISVQDQPNIELAIDVGATPITGSEGVFEVTLKLKARAGTADAALFLIEMDYAGQFQLQGFSEPDLEPVLLIECPRILFPFARRIIADISAEGGFPPLRIDPVDFAALYQAQRQRAAQAAAAEQNGSDGTQTA